MKRLVVPSLALLAFAWPLVAAEPMEIAKQQADAYVAAFEKGDAGALAALYAPDAEYRFGEAEAAKGREAIGALLKNSFKGQKRRELKVEVESARLLSPDVLVEKGRSGISIDGAEPEWSAYSVTYVRSGEKWLIADLQETSISAADRASEAMADLEWIIGFWKPAKESAVESSKAEWILDGKFITKTFKIDREDGPFASAEIIGYDPQNDRIRSWLFDNEGGYGEGLWTRDGNKWLVAIKAVLPDGRNYSASMIYTQLDEGRVALESQNRMLDGEALPNMDRFEFVRATEQAKKGDGR